MDDISALHLTLMALAVARLCRLVTTEVITEQLREKLWRRFGTPAESHVSYLVTCNWCVSIYASSLIAVWYTILPKLTITACAILALSMVGGFLANRAD